MDFYVTRDGAWIETAEKLQIANKSKKYWEAQEEYYSKLLKVLSENQSSKGGGYIFTKIIRKGTVDYSKIPALKEIDLDKFRKDDIESWKLTLELTLPDQNKIEEK